MGDVERDRIDPGGGLQKVHTDEYCHVLEFNLRCMAFRSVWKRRSLRWLISLVPSAASGEEGGQ